MTQQGTNAGSAAVQLHDSPESMGLVPTGETAAAATAAHARAMVQARYVIAMGRPRDFDQVRERLLKECRRPGFAEVARYRKPVGKGIEGPSIRFVEAAIRCMTNVPVRTQTVFDDAEKRILNVSVGDLESNTYYDTDVTVTKTVERRRIQDGDEVVRKRKNSQGQDVYVIRATDDDILNKQNALISKAIRTAGLRLLPGDLLDECMDLVIETMRTKDAADPDAAKKKLFDSFGGVGVTVEQIKEYLGHDAKTLTPKELQDLRGLFAALRDGETDWREVMDAKSPAKEGETNAAAEKLKAKLAEKARKPGAAGAPADAPKMSRAASITFIRDGEKVLGPERWTMILAERGVKPDKLDAASDLTLEVILAACNAAASE